MENMYGTMFISHYLLTNHAKSLKYRQNNYSSHGETVQLSMFNNYKRVCLRQFTLRASLISTILVSTKN